MDALASRLKFVDAAASISESKFDLGFVSPVRAVADWFADLPLAMDVWREPGGAVRASLETGYYAMRLAEGTVFGAQLSIEKRRGIEQQYRRAAYLAGLCSYLALRDERFSVIKPSTGEVWSGSLIEEGSLTAWLGGENYEITAKRSPATPDRSITVLHARAILTGAVLDGLESEVRAQLFGAIAPDPQKQGVSSPLERVVRAAVRQAHELESDAIKRSMNALVQADLSDEEMAAAVKQKGNATPVPAPVIAPITPAEPAHPELPVVETGDTVSKSAVVDPFAGLTAVTKQFCECLRKDIAKGESKVLEKVKWNSGVLEIQKTLFAQKYGMPTPGAIVAELRRKEFTRPSSSDLLVLTKEFGRLLYPLE